MSYEPLILAGFIVTVLGHFFVLAIKDQMMEPRMRVRALRVASWFGVLAFLYFVLGFMAWLLR